MKSCERRTAILLAIVPMLVSCATARVRAPVPPDLPEAEPDPRAFTSMAFPVGIPVRASVITTQPVGITSDVLSCVEHENEVGFVPPRDVDFVNLYLVRQSLNGDPPRAQLRYLVAELWRYRPAAGVKVRHQWVIWQDEPPLPPSRADYAILVEDLDNRVVSERTAAIGPAVLAELVRFYAAAVDFFTRHPPERPDEADAAALDTPATAADSRAGNRLFDGL